MAEPEKDKDIETYNSWPKELSPDTFLVPAQKLLEEFMELKSLTIEKMVKRSSANVQVDVTKYSQNVINGFKKFLEDRIGDVWKYSISFTEIIPNQHEIISSSSVKHSPVSRQIMMNITVVKIPQETPKK